MITVWDIQRVYSKLRSVRWRIVNDAYGQISVTEYGLHVAARDGSVLNMVPTRDDVHVWVKKHGRARIRILVEHDLAAITSFHCGLGSVTDIIEVLTWAQHNVVYDDDEGYLADMPAVGGRELVIEFVGEEDTDAVRA